MTNKNEDQQIYNLCEKNGEKVVCRYHPPEEYFQYYRERRETLYIDGIFACWLPIFRSTDTKEAEAYLRRLNANVYRAQTNPLKV